MSDIETTSEKKIYIWPIDDAETDRLSNLLKIDFRTFNMKQHYLHSPQYVCHNCGKLTGLDDSVGTALALGNHDKEFIINFITNPEARIFHKHELQCYVDGATYLERYSIESDEGKALYAHFQSLKASGDSTETLSDDAKSGKTAVLEYVPTWFLDAHIPTGAGPEAKVEYYPKWFAGSTAKVEYYPKWLTPEEGAQTAKVEYPVRWFTEQHTGEHEQTAIVEYPVRWFGDKHADTDEKAQTAKVEYPVRWFTGEGAAEGHTTEKKDGTSEAMFEYYPKWFSATGVVFPKEEDTKEKSVNFKYYPKWFTGN